MTGARPSRRRLLKSAGSASIVTALPTKAFSIIQAPLRIENYRKPGGTDDEALGAAIADVNSGRYSRQICWNGPLTLSVQPPPLHRVHLVGDDTLGAKVVKNYRGQILFRLDGPPGQGGGGFHNFSIPTTIHSPGSTLFYYSAANSSFAPDEIVLEHLYLSSGPLERAPFRNIHMDGSLRASPQGIRQPTILFVTCFGTTGGNVYIPGWCGATIESLRTYCVPGTDGDVYIKEGSGWQAADNEMFASTVSSTLRIGNVVNCRLEGTFGAISWDSPSAINVKVVPRNPNSMKTYGELPPSCSITL
jgi:hypothetical protein